MQLRILGCSGGVGQGLHTTALLIDDDILIDVGSGVGELTLAEMTRIRHIFLTHSHLDHIAFLPLLLDSIFDQIQQPLVVHALPETLAALQQHIFNWVIWPDFAQLPRPEAPVLTYSPLRPGEVVNLGGRELEMIAVNHVVPGVGYYVVNHLNGAAFAFSGDTTENDSFWAALNARPRLDLLFVETAFNNTHLALSRLAKHYCPQLLAADLQKLRHDPDIYITHNKPGDEDTIFIELQAAIRSRKLQRLPGGAVFQL